MRRSLVLTDEAARHPFRASLPPHVCRNQAPAAPARKWQLNAGDLRDFLLAYFASSVAAMAFII